MLWWDWCIIIMVDDQVYDEASNSGRCVIFCKAFCYLCKACFWYDVLPGQQRKWSCVVPCMSSSEVLQ